jgi:uncharacterized membrane protein
LSSAKYGRPKAIVEGEITKRMTTETPKPRLGAPTDSSSLLEKYGLDPSGGSRPSLPPQAASPPSGTKPPASSSSFLDEWLAKRKATTSPSATASTTPKTENTASSRSVAPPAPTSAPTPVTDPAKQQSEEPKEEDQPKKPGELKIQHAEGGEDSEKPQEEVHTVRIDRDGNISYES